MTRNKKYFYDEVIVWETIFRNFSLDQFCFSILSYAVDFDHLLEIIGNRNDLYMIAFNVNLFDFTCAESSYVST